MYHRKATSILVLVLGLLSVAVPAAIAEENDDPKQKCKTHGCYKAVVHPGHGGKEECSSYLVTTVTPSTFTVSSTSSFTSRATSTVTLTTSLTIEETATATVTLTSTTTNSSLSSVTSLVKRELRTVAHWASSHCGPDVTASFSSACSCLGVTSTVVTAPKPATTTVYVSVGTTFTTLATVSTETTLTTETTATTTTTTLTTVTAGVCGIDVPCTVRAPNLFRAACGDLQRSCVCNIVNGTGISGSCAQCIADGNFCWTGPSANCCSGVCQDQYCAPRSS